MSPFLFFLMHFDYVFIGAGLSNLSLLHQMSSYDFFKDKTIAIIEPSDKDQNDRTWCLWSKLPPRYTSVSTSWNSLVFKSSSFHKEQNISPYKYYHVASKDFYEETIGEISRYLKPRWFKHSLKSVKFSAIKASLTLDNDEIISAGFVFNSSFKFSGNNINSEGLKQHFYGFKIKTADKDLPVDAVHLMDFSLNTDQSVVQFGYILPFNAKEALIEYTEFSDQLRSKDEYKVLVTDYLRQLGIHEFEVKETEFGAIPMSENPFKDRLNDLFINVGSAGGLTKPTTGYTFQYIQKDCQNVIKALLSGAKIPVRSSQKRFKFYDRLLLRIIKKEPQLVQTIMEKLFSRNKFKSVLKFLDEESSLLEEIRIFMSIPWKPFLKSLFRV